MFQSAPLTKARGDFRDVPIGASLFAFQSAPLTKARGDHIPQGIERREILVSIRSPHKSKGRLGLGAVDLPPSMFQSAPLTKARGDQDGDRYIHRDRLFQSAPLTKARGDSLRRRGATPDNRFNPLPSQKQGETDEETNFYLPDQCFNPLPSQKQGETSCGRGHLHSCHVSIRSPHKSKGRRVSQDP